MPRHEFAIVEDMKEIDNGYNPEKYNCISIDDDLILSLLKKLTIIQAYHNDLNSLKFGLNYYGTTLVPNRSLNEFQSILHSLSSTKNNDDLEELSRLIYEAIQTDKHILHYGI